MSEKTTYTDGVPAYPGQPHEGTPNRYGRGRVVMISAFAVVGVLLGCGLVVGAGFALLSALNPVGDEWVCSEGEAPAGGSCYPEGAELPPGVEWEPFGNRPMSYNCDKDGWVSIERSVTRRGVTSTEEDCVREGTELPGSWSIADDD